MTTQRTLRRKLQKKIKHKLYRKCPRCGARMGCKLVDEGAYSYLMPRLFAVCGSFSTDLSKNGLERHLGGGCGHYYELHWTGKGTGGTADTYRRQGNLLKTPQGVNQRKGASCAGSNPASSTGPVLLGYPIIWTDLEPTVGEITFGMLSVQPPRRGKLEGVAVQFDEGMADGDVRLMPPPISDDDWSNVKKIICNRKTLDEAIEEANK